MTAQAQDILYSFDRLPEDDKREVVSELLRRSAALGNPPWTDDQLVAAAAKDDWLEALRRMADNGVRVARPADDSRESIYEESL